MFEIQSWAGRPSQWTNGPLFLGCFLLAATCSFVALGVDRFRIIALALTAIPILRAALAYLDIRCRSYTLTNQRFQYSFGILSRRFHEVELYRIKDVVLDQPFLLRLFGLSNILVVGFDVVKPIVKIQAVRDGEKVREAFRTLVEARRDAKSVRVSEVG
ncbi:PH domain-containing protein [Burkholderia stagnalis]|uniref:PH domain-containing protein n=1 Tax=Burkholderia stagnalis TaxID=1503054 RepID=UPI0009BFEDDA|nr:PH domain-containing protein [Burkholderia stagnalis]